MRHRNQTADALAVIAERYVKEQKDKIEDGYNQSTEPPRHINLPHKWL